MESSHNKRWKEGYSKMQSNKSTESKDVNMSTEDAALSEDKLEVEAYYQTLKTKTNMSNLWSGDKFYDMVEGQLTPEISSASDSELDENLDMLRNLKGLSLSSEEDEIDRDYSNKNSLDFNNNVLEEEDEEPNSLSSAPNLMGNIHFAELAMSDIDLSKKSEGKSSKDFLPKLQLANFPNSEGDDESQKYSDKHSGAEDFESGPSSSDRLHYQGLSQLESGSIPKKNLDEFIQDISEGETDNDLEDAIPSEIEEGPLSESLDISGSFEKEHEENDTSIDSKSNIVSNNSVSESRGKISISHYSQPSEQTNRTISSHISRHSRRSDKSSIIESVRLEDTIKDSKRSSNRSSMKGYTRSDKSLINKSSAKSSTKSSKHNESTVGGKTSTKGSHSRHNTSHLISGKETANRTSSKSWTYSHSCSQDERSGSSSESRSSRNKKHCCKEAGTQTKVWKKDKSKEVLDFQYDWQVRDRSCIANHVIDPETVDILTTYNPSVLASNDLMKFHMQLLQQHVHHSRCLYEAYASENINTNHKYTTVSDTKKYIKKHRPKVITYEEALELEKKKDEE